jgi:hypothetical protein
LEVNALFISVFKVREDLANTTKLIKAKYPAFNG